MNFRISTIGLLFIISFSAGCTDMLWKPPWEWGKGHGRQSVQPDRVTDASKKLLLALGGNLPGRDELIISDSSGNPREFGDAELVCSSDPDILQFEPRPGFATAAAGSGVRIIPTEEGITAIRCKANGNDLPDEYEVTVPPQSLIQIIVAEAQQQLAEEATKVGEGADAYVAADSDSPTGDAVGSAIRGRIDIINDKDDTNLFEVSSDDYDTKPPVTYYDAVIMATGQFSPTDANDPNHEVFVNAEDRNFLSDEQKIAYDQAVLTAAGVFNGDIKDSTGGAFAFRSPTADEWILLSQALGQAFIEIPEGSGFTDASFPNLAPIQILIQPSVWTYDDGRPAFVFARKRPDNAYAVVNTP